MHPEFQLNADTLYLNHAAVAPWPKRTADAVCAFAAANAGIGARNYPQWIGVEQSLRDRLAGLINAPSSERIALVKNTSEALSFVAEGLPWQAGDNVLSIAQEFPSNRIVWEALADRGVELRLLDLYPSTDPEADLLALCDRNTRLISVSAVQYARGLRMDLERIGAHCRSHDILFCVDAIQQIGALPFDVQAIGADFAAADGHKWMLGPEGLGVFYVREEVQERLRINQFGWHMVEQVGNYDSTDWEIARSARRFECGSPNMLGIHALEASLSLIHELGMDHIQTQLANNVEYCHQLAGRQGLEILSPTEPERRSGIFTFLAPGVDQVKLQARLMQRGVICAPRGGGVRFSPHFYTSTDTLNQAFALVQETVQGMA